MANVEIIFKIRQYETEADIKREVEIHNLIIQKYNPDASLFKVENLKRYRYDKETFEAGQVRFLTVEEDGQELIVGHCGVDIFDHEAHVEYPFILAEYRNREQELKLFTTLLDFAKTKHSVIKSRGYSNKITPIHDFFTAFGFVETDESFFMKATSDDLANLDTPGFSFKGINKADIQSIIDFHNNAKRSSAPFLKKEDLEESFDRGD